MSLATPSFCSRPVPTLAASDSLVQLGLADHPALLTGDGGWPAETAVPEWRSVERLAASVPTLAPARTSDEPAFYNPDAPLAEASRAAGARGFAWAGVSYEESSARTADFFAGPSPPYRYYTGSALDSNGKLRPDLRENLPQIAADAANLRAKVWIGVAGATTPLHADSQHNFYSQLHGTKTLWLLPPTAAASLHVYPRLHPLSHFSRAFPADPRRAINATCAADAPEERRAFVVTLSEGERLYLPPLFFHAARCDSAACISLNLWVPSGAMRTLAEADALPLPFEEKWGTESRAAATLQFLTLLLVHIGEEDPPTAAGAEPSCAAGDGPPSALALVRSRWTAADELLHADRPPSGLEAAKCLPPWMPETLLDKFDAYARKRAAVLARIEPAAVRATLLADWMEQIAGWATGAPAPSHDLLERLRACAAEVGLD